MLSRHIWCQIDLGNFERGMLGAPVLSPWEWIQGHGHQPLLLVTAATLIALEVGPFRTFV